MIIGIDFDNTIVNYDGVFTKAAAEKNMLPNNVLNTKESVKKFLLSEGREAEWTELQGYVYGTKMDDAETYQGVADFFGKCSELGWETVVISHKTKHPIIGPKYDLHAAAYQFLNSSGLKISDVFFETTREYKYARIASARCNIFVDDLPGFLIDDYFPENVNRILFDPNNQHNEKDEFIKIESWQKIKTFILDNSLASV